MPEIKWIKLTTDIFDNEKIRLIEAMPDADTLLIIWIKLLCQAGKVNANGYIFLAADIPFTEENLATLFGRPLNTIRLALTTFQRLNMIQLDENGVIFLPNWEKYQNVVGLETIRENNRLRQQKHRLLLKQDGNVMSRDNNEMSRYQNKNKKENKNNTIINNRDENSDESISEFTETIDESEQMDVLEVGDNEITIGVKKATPIAEVFARIDKIRGYKPPKRKAEAASILRMLKTYTPDQIITTWQNIKQEPFWNGKELYMMSVESQIGAKLKGNEKKTSEQQKYACMIQK